LAHLHKIYLLSFLLLFTAGSLFAQLTVSGIVYDSTRTIPVKNVLVKSKSGKQIITDSLGRYSIVVTKKDSLAFIYRNKSTPEFAVSEISDMTNFDISIQVRVFGKFKTLKEVRITSKTYREDSIENREDYEHIFNYSKPGFSLSENDGNAGIDLDQMIDMFRFRRNKEMRMMQARLIDEEQDKYVDYKFNKILIRRITTIDSADIPVFLRIYRPSFYFSQTASQADFYQYILDASYQFKAQKQTQDSLKISGR
jgi:hypothetical protein